MNNKNAIERTYYQEDNIDIRKVLRSLSGYKWLIFWSTSVALVLSVVVALLWLTTYITSVSFLSTDEPSVLLINQAKMTSETSQSLFKKFLIPMDTLISLMRRMTKLKIVSLPIT